MAVIASWGYFGWLGKQEGPTFTYNGPILLVERQYQQELKEAAKSGEKRELNKVHARYPQFQKPFYQDWAEAAVFAIFRGGLYPFVIDRVIHHPDAFDGG